MINPVRPDEYDFFLPLEGDSMFECGGKQNPHVVKGKNTTYKSWFEGLGYRHISVDWDGRFGAIERDLRQPLWQEFGQFDMVTNIGTSEHVSDQAGFWENIHNLTKKHGLYVGQCPYYDGKSWWWHGNYYPTEAFYESFADLNGWSIERMGRGLKPPNENLYVRMRKIEDLSFTMPDASLIHFNRMRRR